ncbi:hypothetical protein L1887_08298 [Cichorium endivia]|nr:hypothetical protein L1887_08298 [Cichorium endivia]
MKEDRKSNHPRFGPQQQCFNLPSLSGLSSLTPSPDTGHRLTPAQGVTLSSLSSLNSHRSDFLTGFSGIIFKFRKDDSSCCW